MSLSKELIDGLKITPAVTLAEGAAGTTDVTGATIDMSGYTGVLAVVRFGAIVTNAVTSIKMQQDTDSAMGTAADLAGTGQTVADDDDGATFYINLHKPRERYVRLIVDRGTQNATVAAAEYYQYGPTTVPVASHGALVVGESHVSPAEGTA